MNEELEKGRLATRIGLAIRDRRKSAKLTLTEASKLAGVSVSHLSSIENGLTLASLPVLARIAPALGSTLADLTRDDERFVIHTAKVPDAGGESVELNHPSLQLDARGVSLATGETLDISLSADDDLFVYVISGAIMIEVDGEEYELTANDALDARSPGSAAIRTVLAAVIVWAASPNVRSN
jgi:transcriptional regulator with XRE-family HTH domain